MNWGALSRKTGEIINKTPKAANQNKASKSRLIGGLLAAAIATIGGYEGLRLYSYQDVVGVWTACYGETKGMKAGLRFTKQECDIQFAERLVEFEQGMRRCLVAPDTLPDGVYIPFLDLSYNVGVGAFCGSTLARKANAGDLRGACDELSKWDKAGGKAYRGLTRRRAEMEAMCLKAAA